MYDLLFNIAERCHTAATRRGKDTTGVGCIKSLRIELGEYWKAADRSAETPEFDEIIEKTDKLSDEDFTAYYEANLHNTAADELADRHDIERLRKMVNLKMRFNELRKD